MSRRNVGNCQENCPIIALLEGREVSANMLDGIKAEELAQDERPRDQLMEACEPGGPHKVLLGFGGRLACSSQHMPNRLDYTDRAAMGFAAPNEL